MKPRPRADPCRHKTEQRLLLGAATQVATVERLAIILGAAKSGTSTLFDLLAQHPQLCACRTKEPGFFTDLELHARGPAVYDAMFPFDPVRHAWALEATPLYTWDGVLPNTTGVAERMRMLGREYRFIYVMREPIARIESHITYESAKSPVGGFDPRASALPPWLLAITDYHRQLEVYRRCFSREQMFLLRFEELTQAPEASLARIEAFLGLSPHAYPQPDQHLNKTTNQRVPVGTWNRLRAIEPLRKLVRLLPVSARAPVRRLFSKQVEGNVRLNAAQRSHARGVLAPSMQALARDYGVDVSGWGF